MRLAKGMRVGLFTIVFCLLISGALAAAPVNITMWHPFPDREEFGAWQTLVDRFNAENPDISVTLEGKAGMTSSPDGLIVPVASGAGPDLAFFSYAWTPMLSANEVFLNLRPMMERDGFLPELEEDFLPGTHSALGWQGGIYGVPADVSVMVPMYLPEVLDVSGVAAPAPGWTWDDMIDLVRSVRRMGSNGEWDIYPGLDDHPLHTYLPIVLQAGARFFDNDARSSAVDSAEMREGLEFLTRLFDEEYLVWTPDRRDVFMAGKGAILFGSDASIGNLFLDQRPNMRVAHPPRHPNREPVTSMVFHSLSVVRSGDSEREEAAWKLLRYLTTTDSLVHVARISGKMPPRISALRDADFQYDRREYPALMDVLEVLPMGTTDGWVGVPDAGPYLRGVLSAGLGKARPGPNRASVEEIVEEMHVGTQNVLDDFWNNYQATDR